MKTKNIIRIIIGTALLLLIPLLGRWPWTPSDFVIAAALLIGTGFAYEFIASRGNTSTYRLAVGIAAVTSLALVWVNLAVGIIGSEDNPANLMYFGVILIGLIGAAIARLKPLGMSRALFTMAFAQFLVPIIAVIIWRPDFSPGVAQVFILNAFFVMMFVVSGLLFQHADTVHSELTSA